MTNYPPTDPETGEPIIYLVDTIETRLTQEGEVGYAPGLGGTAITAVLHEQPKQIGDTDQASYPSVLSKPDLDSHGEPFEG